MLSKTAVGFLILSTIASIAAQTTASPSSTEFSPEQSASFSALRSSYAVAFKSVFEAEATAIVTNSAIQAALSTVSGISTKNVAADLATAVDEIFVLGNTVTASELQYLSAIPSGPGVALVTSVAAAVFATLDQEFLVTASSGFATSTGGAGTGLQASGVAKPTGAAGTGSQIAGVAKPTSAAGAKSTGAQSTDGAKTTATPKSSQTGAKSSAAAKSQSTSSSTGGVVSQPTGAIMAAGAAAAGVLGFAAMF